MWDLVEFAGNLGAAHAHDGAVHVDVLAAGHFGVESSAHFEEACDAALGADDARGGGGHAAERLDLPIALMRVSQERTCSFL